jgi:single-stranded DNA-binding protein
MITPEGFLEGNVGSAKLEYGSTGKPRFTVNIAVSNDYWDKATSQWVKKPPTWYRFVIWDEERIKRFGWLTVGMHVLVKFNGLEVKEYTKNGEKTFSLELKFVSDILEVKYNKKVDLDSGTGTSDDITDLA